MSRKESSQALRRASFTEADPPASAVRLKKTCTPDVAAGDALADGGADGRFDGVEFHGHVEMEVEAAVVDGFNGEGQLTGGDGARHAGEAGHAANGVHGFTSGSGSRYCRSCSRW